LGRGQPGRRGGSFGAIGTTSFSVAKVVTTGQGGAVLAHLPQDRDEAIRVIDQGDTEWRRTNLNRGIGSNLRLSDLSAALGMVQLGRLEERLERKRRAYEVFADRLDARLFRASDGEPPMQNIVFTTDPDALVVRLRKAGILATRQYRPMYHHPPYAYLRDREFRASEFWYAHSVYLPFGVALSEEEAERIAKAVISTDIKLIDAPSSRN
jgi:perosamine synthetase